MASCRSTLVFVAIIAHLYLAVGGTVYSFSTNAGSVQTWTVPANVYRIAISAVGGSGGVSIANAANSSGLAMTVSGEFVVTPGQVLNIVVGQAGANSPSVNTSGTGGGGSFVWNNANNSYPLVAAGGGGGSSSLNLDGDINNYGGQNAVATTQGGVSASGVAGAFDGTSASGEAGGKGWIDVRAAAAGKIGFYAAGAYGGGGGSGHNESNCVNCTGVRFAAGSGGGYSGGAAGNVNYKYGGGGGGSYNGAVSSSAFALATTRGSGSVTITTVVSCVYGILNAASTACLNCTLGYTGADCNTTYNCAVSPDRTHSSNYPVLNPAATSYANNTLYVSILSLKVVSRNFTVATLDGATAGSCSRNGANSFWTLNKLLCQDELKLALPWNNHTLCGFTEYFSDASIITYKTKVNLEYTEQLGNFSAIPIQRLTKHSYDVSVSFPKSITVSFDNIVVQSLVNVDVALTSERYSSATGILNIEITTAVVWSSMLNLAMTMVTPATVMVVAGPNFDQSACTTVAGTLCLQKISFALRLVDNTTCTFDGAYSANSTIFACRENNGTGCATSGVNIDFSIYTGSVCTRVDVRPSITGALTAYAAADFTTAKQNYKLGDLVYFVVSTNAGTGNVVSINFVDISYFDGTNTTYLMGGKTATPTGTSSSLTLYNAQAYFTLYLSGSVFQMPFGASSSYIFTAKCEVTFAGNKKRMVSMDMPVDGQFSANTFIELEEDDMILDPEEDYEDDEAVMGPDVAEESGVFYLAAIAGVVVGTITLPFVAYLYKRVTANNNSRGYMRLSSTAVQH